MKGLLFSFTLLLFVVICWGVEQKVLLKNVQTLTLHKGQYTTGRRSSPQPQVKCVGGAARGRFEPRTVQCYNRGSDGNDIQWECKAEMSDEFEFGKIVVSCEGYDYPDDPYVLQGSCGLEYDLEYSTSGRKSHGVQKKDEGSGWVTVVSLLFLLFVLYLIFLNFGPRAGGEGDRERFGLSSVLLKSLSGTGFDGGPGYPPRGPPPPYDDYKTQTMGRGAGGGFQPGFWSGAGLGALGGYFLGRRNAPPSTGWRASPSSSSQWERDSGFGSSNAPSTSSSTHESTGYGGTRRR